jgi:hypothetical protein
LTVVFVAGACSSSDRDKEERIFDDQGTLCVGMPGPSCETHALSSGQPLMVYVNFDICMSGSCDHAGPTRCEVTRAGSLLEVHAHGSYTHDAAAKECTLDCRQLSATCLTDVLPDDSYELHYGDQTLSFEIPSDRCRCTAHN